MPDDRKRCWLMEGCPSRTGVCYSCVPDGDDCPIWRWFKKQIVVRCKDCKHLERLPWLDDETGKAMVCRKHTFTGMRTEDWFCADGERE